MSKALESVKNIRDVYNSCKDNKGKKIKIKNLLVLVCKVIMLLKIK